MPERPVIKATRNIARASQSQVEALQGKPVGNIVDAMGRVGAINHQIRPLTSARRFVGTALPVNAGPRDNLAPWAALRLAEPGDVLMVRTGDHENAAVVGDLLLGMAKNAGVIAFVTDGMVRDVPACDALGMPVYARGHTPNSPYKQGPGSVGLPIVLGGVRVAAGDIVCADEDGVAVVPADWIDAVIAGLAAIERFEADLDNRVKAGEKYPPWIAEPDLEALYDFVD
jgi:4-hydroxy-4-methyl-2-oxoglutarate aldolase